MEFLSDEYLRSLAEQYGSPLYVYNTESITRQYEKLKHAFRHQPSKIFYAAKALTNVNVLRHLRELGSCIDCVSVNEVKLALVAGFKPDDVLYTPNCVALDEIIEAKDLGVRLNLDNISILEQFGNRVGGSYPVCIRLNPHIMAGGHYKISTGHIDSKFGISIHQMRHIERIVKKTGLHVEGVHMHTGSEIKDINVFLEGLDVMFSMADHFPELKYIDMGSGFKVPYQADEKETDVALLGEKVAEAFAKYQSESGKQLEVWFEPGKFLVSKCGYLIVKANVIKQTPAAVFAGVDSGFNHLIRPMMYEAYHHIQNISNPNGTPRIYSVVGNICETDTFAWDRTLPEIREGDFLAFYNAGAYGFEMSSNFNSRLRPAEVMTDGRDSRVIRKREKFEDLLTGQIF